MDDLSYLLENNVNWSSKEKETDPAFFSRLSAQQKPKYLWIGCSDSRVPANQIVGLPPGEIFVHRNISNLVVHSDLNCMSVLQYSVEILKVKHIIVCGHYGCGGVEAALKNNDLGLIDNWLRHIKDIGEKNSEELLQCDKAERANLLCELNVLAQVKNVCNSTVVQRAWKNGAELSVHGWIYSIEDGLLKDLDLTVEGYE